MLRAVTVDFWGTLILVGAVADDRYRQKRLADFQAILEAAGLRVSPKALARGYDFSARELAWIWSENRDVPVERHVLAILEGTEAGLSARVSADTLGILVEAYASPALLVPPPPDEGARAALEGLAGRGLALAVVSNTMRTPGVTLRKILDGHGLLRPFTHLTFSDEVGVRKPAAEIFHLTLRRLGVDPAEAVHVGDDGVLDVKGARRAGMRAIQVTPDGAPRGPEAPDIVITGLAELPAAIAKLESAA
jgi:putative hydrolase of the HAD superfamily